ncbi:hypothetical protein M413DRAFT_98679 [Hebeloma cylindrosporum]|uniref:Uncharacterized protein n=1 Tax=Hebeloma cylindrosporum TaxID=76867 RepID=A0A0C3CZB1_HEBCY|nr:hypothetical protein M413DRAFT_98679 [Hebeloma cylindrosporum h7]
MNDHFLSGFSQDGFDPMRNRSSSRANTQEGRRTQEWRGCRRSPIISHLHLMMNTNVCRPWRSYNQRERWNRYAERSDQVEDQVDGLYQTPHEQIPSKVHDIEKLT